MIQFFNKKMSKKRKGFTLIELIVVIAILGILAAIAIPRFGGLRISSAVKADGSTARGIISAARVHETNTGNAATLDNIIAANLIATPVSASGATGGTGGFSLSGGGNTPYVVTFTPATNHAPYNVLQTVTENAGTWTPSQS